MANKKAYLFSTALALSDDKFSSCISCLKTQENAFCKLCKSEIVLSNMGEAGAKPSTFAMQMAWEKTPDQSDGS